MTDLTTDFDNIMHLFLFVDCFVALCVIFSI